MTPDGTIGIVAGNGSRGLSGDGRPATAAQLAAPFGVAVDGSGNVFILDAGNRRVRKVTPAGIISTVTTGNNPADAGNPTGVAVDAAGNSYAAEMGAVKKVSPSGAVSILAGNGKPGFSGDGGPATAAQISPSSLAVDSAGNIYLSDSSNHRIRKIIAGR